VKYLTIENFVITNNDVHIYSVREEDFPSVYKILFSTLNTKRNEKNTESHLSRIRKSVESSSIILEGNSNSREWFYNTRFELKTIFELVLNFSYSKLIELHSTKNKFQEMIVLASDSFVFLDLAYYFSHLVSEDNEYSWTYSFSGSCDFGVIMKQNYISSFRRLFNSVKRVVGRILDQFLLDLSQEVCSLMDNYLTENEGSFGYCYATIVKPSKESSKRKVVPFKTERRIIIEHALKILEPLMETVFKSANISEDIRNGFLHNSCKTIVNTYVDFISKKHEDNKAELSKKHKKIGDRKKAFDKLSQSMLDQLTNDRIAVSSFLTKYTSFQPIQIEAISYSLITLSRNCESTLKAVGTPTDILLKPSKKNQIVPSY